MQIVMTGPDTFKVVQDTPDVPRNQKYTPWEGEGEKPPLPPVNANASPVYLQKTQTANEYDYTPEARQLLHDTPVEVKYQPYERMQEKGDPAGYYVPPQPDGSGKNIMIYEPEGPKSYSQQTNTGEASFPSAGTNVLGHEFGHKWMYEKMPTHLRDRWFEEDWPSSYNFTPDRLQTIKEDYPQDIPKLASEGYAMMAQRHPTLRQPREMEIYNRYFAGLYRDTPARFEPPPPPPMDFSNRNWHSPFPNTFGGSSGARG